MIAPQVVTQLDELLKQLAQEETRFQTRACEMLIDDRKMVSMHSQMLATLGERHNHVRLKEVHEAMFKVHRKIQRQHQQAIQQGIILRERVREGVYEDADLTARIERLQLLFIKIREEHEEMERERIKILSEHRAYASSLGLGATEG